MNLLVVQQLNLTAINSCSGLCSGKLTCKDDRKFTNRLPVHNRPEKLITLSEFPVEYQESWDKAFVPLESQTAFLRACATICFNPSPVTVLCYTTGWWNYWICIGYIKLGHRLLQTELVADQLHAGYTPLQTLDYRLVFSHHQRLQELVCR